MCILFVVPFVIDVVVVAVLLLHLLTPAPYWAYFSRFRLEAATEHWPISRLGALTPPGWPSYLRSLPLPPFGGALLVRLFSFFPAASPVQLLIVAFTSFGRHPPSVPLGVSGSSCEPRHTGLRLVAPLGCEPLAELRLCSLLAPLAPTTPLSLAFTLCR